MGGGSSGVTSITMKEVDPEHSARPFPGEEGIEAVKKATRLSLSRVEPGEDQKGDSSILASHHGFTFWEVRLCGDAEGDKGFCRGGTGTETFDCVQGSVSDSERQKIYQALRSR